MFSQIVALALAALIAQPAAAASCTRQYTVKEGDFCDAISAAQNVSTYQLYVNNIASVNAECSNLMPNQILCLGTTGKDCTATYVVQENDTCEAIESATGANSTILNHNNPQINDDCTNIYTGEVLCVATTALVPDAPTTASAPVPTNPATTASASVHTSHATTTAPKVTATAKAGSGSLSSGSGDDDDDNLPWCDEL